MNKKGDIEFPSLRIAELIIIGLTLIVITVLAVISMVAYLLAPIFYYL